MNHKQNIFDEEKVHFNLVKYQKFGKNFEVVVDPDAAIDFKQKKTKDKELIPEIVKAEKVFTDAKKGLIASPENLKEVFGTENFNDVFLKMIAEGEIQITSEHREKLRKEKKQKIVYMIHRSAVDPRTGSPHPIVRIENAMEEAKIKIDEFKKAEDQVQDIMSKLKPIIPIKFEQAVMTIRMPMKFASKLHSTLQGYGKLEQENWVGEHFFCKITIPAGLKGDFMDELNSKTHGAVDIEFQK